MTTENSSVLVLGIDAGGTMTDWSGRPLAQGSDGRVVAAGDPACHAAALARLAG